MSVDLRGSARVHASTTARTRTHAAITPCSKYHAEEVSSSGNSRAARAAVEAVERVRLTESR